MSPSNKKSNFICKTLCSTSGVPPVDHGYAWVIVAASTIIFMLSIGVFRTQTVFLEPVREKYNVTHGMMTLMATCMSIASQLITLPGNVMSEWLGPRVNVMVAGACGVLCFVICAFAPSFWIYFVSYVLLQGAAFALCYSPIVVMVNRYFKVYRPLASSIALGGVSIGTMVIPNVLLALRTSMGLRAILLGAGICMLITIPVAIFLRTITLDQLALLDAQSKNPPPPPPTEPNEAAEHREEAIELVQGTNKGEQKVDPDAITPDPVVVGDEDANGATEADKKEGMNELETQEKLLAPAPEKSQPASGQVVQAVEIKEEAKEQPKQKKKSSVASAFAYFKNIPPLFKSPTYLIHAVHFAVMFCVDMIFLSITFDSYLKEMDVPSGWVLTSRTAFAIANFIGRFVSGLFVVMPVFIAKCSKAKEQGSGTGCYDTIKKYLTVRILYCGAAVIFCIATLVLAIAALSGGSQWSLPLVFVYIVVGVSGGCMFSQFPVVLAELVGLPKLAAAHALFMLIQVPINALQFICGLIKSGTGSWKLAYVLCLILCVIFTIINCANLLLGPFINRLLRRIFSRKSAQPV